jgi:hypothetical protein
MAGRRLVVGWWELIGRGGNIKLMAVNAFCHVHLDLSSTRVSEIYFA